MPDIQFGSRAHRRENYRTPYQPLVNLFAEEAPVDPSRQFNLLPTPGLSLFSTLGSTGRCTGIYRNEGVFSGQIFAVCNGDLYRTDLGGNTPQRIGTVTDGLKTNGSARIVGLRNGLAVLQGESNSVYLYEGSGVTKITDNDLGNSVKDIAFINQRLLAITTNDQFAWSELLDYDNFNGLSFATAERSPDNLRAILINNQSVWLMGSETIEVWQDRGGSAVFVPLDAVVIDRGLLARDAAVVEDNTIYFVGDDRIVYRLAGYEPVPISDNFVAERLNRIPQDEVKNISMWAYTQDGHKFIGVRTKCDGTHVYDITTGMWHERETDSRNKKRYRVLKIAQANNQVIACDGEDNKLYKLDPQVYLDGSDYIVRKASAYVPVRQNTVCMAFHVDASRGEATKSDVDSDVEPQIMLRYSDDEGKTWSNERWRSLGRSGEYTRRLRWLQLGRMRRPGRIFEISYSSPNRIAIYGAGINDIYT